MSRLEAFLNWLYDEGKDEKTIKAYGTTLTQFVDWYIKTIGELDYNQVKPIDIKEYIGYMKHTMDRKQNTINKTIASLKTFFAYLADNRFISTNPMVRIQIQKVNASEKVGEKTVTKWLTKEEQDRFISYVDLEKNEFKRERNLAIVEVMLYTGLRVSEIEELKMDDIKISGDITITVREGKHGKYATVTLIKKHSKSLRNWYKTRQSLTKEEHLDSPYLFVSERSGKLSARGIQVMLNKYAELANMENITPHRFRHTFCKNLANAGVSIETIRKLARHESIQTTAIYLDPSFKEQLEALHKL